MMLVFHRVNGILQPVSCFALARRAIHLKIDIVLWLAETPEQERINLIGDLSKHNIFVSKVFVCLL